MSLELKITDDLKVAMKAKDQAALRSIRAIKAAILLQKTDGSGIELDESGEIKLLQKLVKQRKDSLDIYEKQELTRMLIEDIQRGYNIMFSNLENIDVYVYGMIKNSEANNLNDLTMRQLKSIEKLSKVNNK